MRDTIYREEAIKIIAEHLGIPAENWMKIAEEWIKDVPSAEPDYQEILGWLLAYHTKSFDLHGRYLPNEVIAWLINDFSKEFIAERGQDGQIR